MLAYLYTSTTCLHMHTHPQTICKSCCVRCGALVCVYVTTGTCTSIHNMLACAYTFATCLYTHVHAQHSKHEAVELYNVLIVFSASPTSPSLSLSLSHTHTHMHTHTHAHARTHALLPSPLPQLHSYVSSDVSRHSDSADHTRQVRMDYQTSERIYSEVCASEQKSEWEPGEERLYPRRGHRRLYPHTLVRRYAPRLYWRCYKI